MRTAPCAWIAAGGLLSAIAVIVVYWPALGNGFVWDDSSYILSSPVHHDPARWKEALFQPLTGESVFRPLTLLTFVFQLWAGHTGPGPYHLVNLVIHAANTLLVTVLAWSFFGKDFGQAASSARYAAIIGLLYGLHPAPSESVLWIACRFDLVMAFFLFLALLADRIWKGASWSRAFSIGVLFLAAALSKETAVGFLIALPIVHLAVDRMHPGALRLDTAAKIWTSHHKVYAALLIACVVYLLFRLAVQGPTFGMTNVMQRFSDIGSAWQRVFVVAASLAHYVADAFWPTIDQVPNRTLSLPVDNVIGLLALIAVSGIAFLLVAFARKSAAGRVPCLLMLAFMGSLLPVSNIVPTVTYLDELQIATRYLTFPLALVCLAVYFLILSRVSVASSNLLSAPTVTWIVLGLWILVSVAIVRVTIPKWKDEGTFFQWAISGTGATSWPYLYMNLGGYYLRVGDVERAHDAFTRAARLKVRSAPFASLIWYNLGNVEVKLGNTDQALSSFRQSLTFDPGNVYSRAGLAQVERSRGNAAVAAAVLEEGLRSLEASSRRHADISLLYYELGLAYKELGRIEDSIAALTAARASARNPHRLRVVDEALRAIGNPP